jgi:putative peptidoglycan lipid II flippase
MAATQVNIFVNVAIATYQGTGAVSWLNYAFRIMYLPIGLFGVSIATAVLPTVSRHAARHDDDAVRDTLTDGLSLMLMLNIPATVGLVTLAEPIVRLLLERRAFTPADTVATAAALRFYVIGLVGYSIVRIASPTFYALGLNRTPVKVSVATVLVNAALNIVLARVMGYAGLALGTACAALFNAAALIFFMRRRLHGLNERRLAGSLTRIAIASAGMGVAAVAIERALGAWMPGRALALQAIRLAIAIGASLGVLALLAHMLHLREFREGVALVTRRFRRRAS